MRAAKNFVGSRDLDFGCRAAMPTARKRFLGLWIEQMEGAKFWRNVVNKLKARSQRYLVAKGAGWKGSPERDYNGIFVNRCLSVHYAFDPEQLGLRQLGRSQSNYAFTRNDLSDRSC